MKNDKEKYIIFFWGGGAMKVIKQGYDLESDVNCILKTENIEYAHVDCDITVIKTDWHEITIKSFAGHDGTGINYYIISI